MMQLSLKLSPVLLVLTALGAPCIHISRSSPGANLLFVNAVAAAAEAFPRLNWDLLVSLNSRTGKMPPELKKHDGTIVSVPGFVIPLEDNDEAVSEFLLVPYPMACIHMPTPPPNQIVHVKMDRGKKIKFDFYEPLWIQGRLKIQRNQNMYGEASFFMAGFSSEPYREK